MNVGSAIGVVLVIVVGVIGLQIAEDVITNASFTGTLKTVTDNITVLFGVGLLVVAVAWAKLF